MLVSLCPIRADAMERLDTPDYKVAFYAFDCDIIYYETPTELSNALVNDEVDALVNSYIRIPEDEQTIENFGEMPYYIMARKVDQALIDRLDDAIDSMNVETPNWRTEFYNKYYGSEENNRELTEAEQTLLKKMQDGGEPIRAVMNPDANPYSWYENGEACGIAADIFRATAEALDLPYEIVPVASKEEYEALVEAGDVDIWMDMSGGDEMRPAAATGLRSHTCQQPCPSCAFAAHRKKSKDSWRMTSISPCGRSFQAYGLTWSLPWSARRRNARSRSSPARRTPRCL